jgi:hypothetical protein
MYLSDLHLNLKLIEKIFPVCGAKFNKETIRVIL